MIGQVRCFIPSIRRGTIQTDAGECVPFQLGEGSLNLQGGDIVEFDAVPAAPLPIRRVTLQRRWVDKLSCEFRPLVNQFHATIRIRS